MKIHIPIVLSLMIACAPFVLSAQSPTAAAKKFSPAVVGINAFSVDKKYYPVAKGSGTGFLISEDGIVVTDYRVIEDASVLVISTGDKKPYFIYGDESDWYDDDAEDAGAGEEDEVEIDEEPFGEILGVDKALGIAVLKITAPGKKFPKLEFADTETLKVGDNVAAVGASLQLGVVKMLLLSASSAVGMPLTPKRSVTTGSVIRRECRSEDHKTASFIQINVPVNPECSGSPLLNSDGKIVGVMFARSGEKAKGGFAIDGNLVQRSIQTILGKSNANRPFVGIFLHDNKDGNAVPVVVDVTPDSPAQRAGLQKGDVIVQIGKRKVHTVKEVQFAISCDCRPGTRVIFTVKRQRNRKKIEIWIGKKQ